jgi:hypothetical protein
MSIFQKAQPPSQKTLPKMTCDHYALISDFLLKML